MDNIDNHLLVHHGVLGMKWGVRRYQNADGTLTEVGKKRYGKTPEQKASEAQKRQDVKNRGTLSNAELQNKIERIKLERELRTLTDQEINRGRKYVADILSDVGKQTLSTALKGATLYGAKAITAGSFDRKELAEAIFKGGK